MHESLILTLCEMQATLFVLSRENGYASESFLKTFMHSATAHDLDKPYHHMQWAGEQYLLSRLKDENGDQLIPGELYDTETLYWTGYLYRFWHFHTGESSREIYKQAPAKTMRVVYLPYHTMSPAMAVERLKDTCASRKPAAGT